LVYLGDRVQLRLKGNEMAAKTLTQTTGTVTSADGTSIAYTRTGEGPALVLVDGALCYRGFGPAKPFAKELASHYTVYTYDRRGRGDSGDTGPYDPRREVEDLAAVIGAAGGSGYVFGQSSGAALALEAAHSGVPIEKLAVYEAPFIVDDSREPADPGFLAQLQDDVAADRRGDVLKRFMKFVGMPGVMIAIMRLTPPWRQLKTVAHTVPYDVTIVRPHQIGEPIPAGRWDGATMPVLAVGGGKSETWMQNAQRAIAETLPNADHRTLEGQNHMLQAKAIAPLLRDFFTA